VVFDPLAIDPDVALEEAEARVAELLGDPVVADVHAEHLPVRLSGEDLSGDEWPMKPFTPSDQDLHADSDRDGPNPHDTGVSPSSREFPGTPAASSARPAS
jgi:hypothetical protein